MPVCLSLRTSYLIGITDNSALGLIWTSEFPCEAALLCEQLFPTPYLQLKKKLFSPWTNFQSSVCEDFWHRDCVESKLKLQWIFLPTWSQIRAEARFCFLNMKFLFKSFWIAHLLRAWCSNHDCGFDPHAVHSLKVWTWWCRSLPTQNIL